MFASRSIPLAAWRNVFCAGLLILALLASVPFSRAQNAPAPAGNRAVVHQGDSQAEIESKLGQPRMELGKQVGKDNETLLIYAEGQITLINDHATDIPAPLRFVAVSAAPTPTPTMPGNPAYTASGAPPSDTTTPAANSSASTSPEYSSAPSAAPPPKKGFTILSYVFVGVALFAILAGIKIWDKKRSDAPIATFDTGPTLESVEAKLAAATRERNTNKPFASVTKSSRPGFALKPVMPADAEPAPKPSLSKMPFPQPKAPPLAAAPAPAEDAPRPKLTMPMRSPQPVPATSAPAPVAAAESKGTEPPAGLRMGLKLNRPGPPPPPSAGS
jgi:hypothetical protein